MNKKTSLILTLALLLGLALGSPAQASGPVHWSYEGSTGPAYWGSLSPEFAACSTGQEQSPVDIPDSAQLNAESLKLSYQPTPLTIENNGHTIQVASQPGNALELAGVPFALSQFHLHAESEHTLAGRRFPMELHLVHKAGDGRVAVIGMMVEVGAENAAWAPILNNMPAEEGEPQAIAGATVNAADLLPVDQGYYRYNGSLTTPPCTEGVNWIVMKSPVELSPAQIDQFRALYAENYRPVQLLNARTFLAAPAPLAAVPEARPPADVPVTGGVPFAFEAIAAGLGLLKAGAYLRRRSD